MPILAYDTETTGLVKSNLPPEHPSQPHIVQLAVVLYSDDGIKELSSVALIVRPPDGVSVPDEAAAVHGITTALANEAGVPLVAAMGVLANFARLAKTSVAHNHAFDLKVIAAAFHRIGRPEPALNSVCTMTMAAPIVNLPPTAKMVSAGFGGKPKPPNLTEAIRFFFGEELEGAHDALVDARACARIYFEMMRRREAVSPESSR